MNIVPDQFVFEDPISNFDPNLTSANDFCTAIDENAAVQQTAITSFQAIASNYNEISPSNADISLVPSSEIPNNCITYSNVIFVPTIANDGHQIADSIELVKNEIESVAPQINDASSSFKYVVSSDPRFVNSYIQTSSLNSTSAVLSNTPSDTFNDLIVNGISNETNQLAQQLHHVEPIDQNQIAVQMHSANDQEVLLQDEHGQLYRQIHNIYVDGTELLPIISESVGISGVGYSNNDIDRVQNTYQEKVDQATFQIPDNFVTNTITNDPSTNTVDTNSEMQEVEFIFNSYRNTRPLTDISQSNHIDSNQISNQYEVVQNPGGQNYQSHIQSNKEQQTLLESTMSTLCKN